MIKALVLNTFYANHSNIKSAAVRKQILICSVFNLTSFCLLLLFSIDAVSKENYFLATIDIGFSLLSGVNYLYLRLTGNYRVSSLIVVATMIALCLFLLCTGGKDNTGPLWFFILPMLIFYILGFRHGRIVLAILLVLTIAILFIPGMPLLQAQYHPSFYSRFLCAFISVSIVAYAYEYTMEDGRQELINLSRKFEILSRRDTLTGLVNRRAIGEKLVSEMDRVERSQKSFSVLMMDIDNFKNINDTYGHVCGDYILLATAKILTTSTQKRDCISRWGGEEFLILLPETSRQKATKVAERLRLTIADHDYSYENIPIKMTISIGVAEYSPKETIDTLISRADQLLYKAKGSGKNRVVSISNDL